MEELKIYDGRSSFWQWDLEQKLIVPEHLGSEIHFSNPKYDKTPVCDVYDLDSVRLVNVPNIMLQDDLPLTVYAYTVDEKGSRTTYVQAFKVVARPKPDDYVYTETEIRTWEDLDERIKALENSGIDPETIKGAVEDYLAQNPIQETDPTVPAWAKQPEKPTYTAEEVGALPAGTVIPAVPDKLPNPHKLTFTGAVSAEYDGSEPVEVNIPEGGSGGGGIPIPDTAEVGQTIVVKAVDENGKPTEWEAADLPSGGSEKVSRLINTVTLEAGVSAVEISTDSDGNPFSVKRLVFEHIPNGSAATAFHCTLTINGTTRNVMGSYGSSYYSSANNGTRIVIIDVLSGEVFAVRHTNTAKETGGTWNRLVNAQSLHDYLLSQKSINSIELLSNNGTPFNEGDVIKIYGY